MARRRRFFNPRQPRDSRGRWTKGGGSSRSRSGGSKFKSGRRILTAAEQRKKSQRLDSVRGTINGTIVGATLGTAILPFYGTAIGAAIGASSSAGRRRKRKRRSR